MNAKRKGPAAITAKETRYLRTAERLNNDAGLLPQSYTYTGRGRKRQTRFTPCAKAEVYLAALIEPGGYRPEALCGVGLADISTETAGIAVTQRAALTPCPCHGDWGYFKLQELEFSAKETP